MEAESPGTPSSGKSKLDSLPKEDLIKYAKKQMVMLQRLKTKNDEITKELQEKKSIHLENAQVIQDVTERLNQVLSEKAELELRLREEHKRGRQEAEFEMEKSLLQERSELERLSGEVEDQAIKHADQLAELRAQHQENMQQLHHELESRAQGEECEVADLREQVRRMKLEREAAEARWKNMDELLEKTRVEKEFISAEVEDLRSQWEVANEVKRHCELETVELREQLNKLMMQHEEEQKMWKEHVKEERSKPDGEVQRLVEMLPSIERNSNFVYDQDEIFFASESVRLVEEGQHLHRTIPSITMEPDRLESHS
uniref:GRIP and coiled-coil domain-containing protein 2-like n=1 Tax=Myxine glutinosa TaxID=7769 RepID=UPI00358F256C